MLTRILLTAIVVFAATTLPAAPAQAQSETTEVAPPPPPKEPSAAGPFARGNKRAGIYGGAGSTLGQTYFIIGGGASFFVADGLEIGADFEGWLFQDPTIWKLSPQVRYTLWQTAPFRPYVGAFWRRTWVGDPFDDYNSWGGRGGITYARGRGFVGAGMVYERFDEKVDGDQGVWYPEVSFSVFF